MVAVVVLQHAEISKLIQQFVEALVVGRVVFLGVQRMQLGVGVVLAHLEEIAGQQVEQQVQRRFARRGIHLVLEDAGQAPVFRCVGGHLNLAGHAVGDVADKLQEFGVGILVAFVLGDKLGGHLWHGMEN